ncbi:MAG: hypothetical protein ABEI99_06670, partial [Halobaculum sp.]
RRPRGFVQPAVCDNVQDFPDVKGGIYTSPESPSTADSNRGYGTIGFRAKKDGTYYMLTAMHVFGDCSITNGDDVYMNESKLGEVSGGDVDGDWIEVDDSGSGSDSLTNKVVEPDGTTRSISGYASECEIERRVSDLLDGYTTVGVTSGETTGGLGECNVGFDTCPTLYMEGVTGSADFAQGDSGAPCYSIENGDAFMLKLGQYLVDLKDTNSCQGQEANRGDKSLGIPAYYIANQGYDIGV